MKRVKWLFPVLAGVALLCAALATEGAAVHCNQKICVLKKGCKLQVNGPPVGVHCLGGINCNWDFCID